MAMATMSDKKKSCLIKKCVDFENYSTDHLENHLSVYISYKFTLARVPAHTPITIMYTLFVFHRHSVLL